MDKEQRIANENLKEFIRYSSSPWRIVWTNFVAGIFRGLGTLLGASMVIALLVWLLTLVADMPVVGEYANDFKATVSGYVRDTNYNDEFDRLGNVLERIEQDLKDDNGQPQ
jgi:hypothetical protein